MENINKSNSFSKPDIQIDIQKWLSKIVSFWWLFVLGLLISIPTAQFYLRYATPLYSAKAKILIKGVGSGSDLSETGILVEELGISAGGKDMDNEIQIMTSRPIMTKIIKNLKANITYYRQGRIKNSELYTMSPIRLDSFQLFDYSHHIALFNICGL